MDVILRPWRLYANFDGRSRRTEYFVFILIRYGLLIGLIFALGAMGALVDRTTGDPAASRPLAIAFVVVLGIFFLATIVPSWSVTVRRLHDQGKSFKWIFLTFVPYIGPIAALVFGFWPGDDFENDYGPDPRHPEQVSGDELGGVFS